MTFERFKQLWVDAGLELPTQTDSSPELIDALVASSYGDHGHFEAVRQLLVDRDALNANSPIDRGWIPVSKEITEKAIQIVLDKATKRDEHLNDTN